MQLRSIYHIDPISRDTSERYSGIGASDDMRPSDMEAHPGNATRDLTFLEVLARFNVESGPDKTFNSRPKPLSKTHPGREEGKGQQLDVTG